MLKILVHHGKYRSSSLVVQRDSTLLRHTPRGDLKDRGKHRHHQQHKADGYQHFDEGKRGAIL